MMKIGMLVNHATLQNYLVLLISDYSSESNIRFGINHLSELFGLANFAILLLSGRPKLKFRQQFRPKLPVSAKFRFRPKPKKVSAETQEKFFIIAALF